MALAPEERWQRVEELFHRASECAAEERSTLLEEWCAGDRALREEVESLLQAASEAERLAGVPQEPAEPPEAERWIGRTLGAFHLERLIGRGGMGAVYFGRRIGGDFEQEVALKLASGPFRSPWLRQRFLEERQTLASLNHPNIARLLDGGITESGEPYLVMEYVDGLRLDRYCEQTRASVPAVLRLSLQLCDAVSFAHRHLVIHRDLKPANVLVTPEGRVKLLDFGAAKLLHPDPAIGHQATRMGMRAFTPQYASPEQVLGTTTTAASDVYSLGVILYRLLSGRLPFDLHDLSSAEAVQTVMATVPVSPHEAITRPAPGGSANATTAEEVRIRRGELRGDLDAIVLKALRARPEERYGSVDELAADLRNHLEHRPVGARQGSAAYRAFKFVRRHALAFGATLAITTALAAGVAVTARQGRIAAAEERRARAGFQNVRRLANLLLFDFYDQVKQLQGSTDVQRRLVTQAVAYLDGLARGPWTEPDIQLDLVEAYTKMGNVLGNPYEENLGDAPKALASLEKALHLAESLDRLRPEDPAVARRLGLARRSLAEVHFSIGNTTRAIEYSRAAARSFEGLAGRPAATVPDIQEAASTLDSLGDLYGLHGSASMGDLGAALDSYRHALVLHRRALALDPGNVRSQRGTAIEQMKIANVQGDTEPTVAAQSYADALAALNRLPEKARKAMPTPRIAAIISRGLGTLYYEIARPGEAIPYLVSARDLFASLAERDPDDTRTRYDLANADYELGQVRESMGDRIGAREDYRRVLGILGELLRRDATNSVWLGHRAEATYRIGRIDRALGRRAEGDRAVREALALALRIAGNANASAADLDRIAGYLVDVEPVEWREPRQALGFATQAVARSHGANAPFLLTLAKAELACGQPEEARQALGKALALLPAPAHGQPATRTRRSVEDMLRGLRERKP
ncbi:MAG: protein kinase [Acidobacteriia bacterium]|nr:protein kinase [Terriglobia bacterium]